MLAFIGRRCVCARARALLALGGPASGRTRSEVGRAVAAARRAGRVHADAVASNGVAPCLPGLAGSKAGARFRPFHRAGVYNWISGYCLLDKHMTTHSTLRVGHARRNAHAQLKVAVVLHRHHKRTCKRGGHDTDTRS